MAEKTLAELVQYHESYEQATVESRQRSERDQDYKDGNQHTAQEAATMKKRGQPLLTFNRIAPKIDFIVGAEIETRTDPKAFPRNHRTDEEAANVATDVIRYVCDNNEWDAERTQCFEDMLVPGTGAIDVRIVPRVGDLGNENIAGYMQPFPGAEGEPEIAVEYVPWDRLFWDPRSRFSDFRDAKFFGTMMWMDHDDAIELWPSKKELLEDSVGSAGQSSANDDTFDDRPRFAVWQETDAERNRVKIVSIWYWSQGKWYFATYTKAGFFEEPTISPYVDEHGQSVPSLVMQSIYVDRENNRFGPVRHLISAQDEINKRRSKSLHLLNVKLVIAEKGAVADTRVAREELAKPDGYVEVNPDAKFEIQRNMDLVSGHFNLLQEAKQEIDAIGANASLTGKDTRDQSGKAIQTRQRGGMIELRRTFDSLRRLQLRVYRHIWARARQFWSEERYFRVRDDENAFKFLGINIPIVAGEALAQQGVEIPDPAGLPPDVVESLRQRVGTRNEISKLDVDIIIEEAPDITTVQQEQFVELAQLATSLPPGTIPFDVIIEASSLRNKKVLLERLRTGGATPEQQQQAAQEKEQAERIQMHMVSVDLAQKQADVGKTRADTIKTMASAQESIADASATASDSQLARLGLGKEPDGKKGKSEL